MFAHQAVRSWVAFASVNCGRAAQIGEHQRHPFDLKTFAFGQWLVDKQIAKALARQQFVRRNRLVLFIYLVAPSGVVGVAPETVQTLADAEGDVNFVVKMGVKRGFAHRAGEFAVGLAQARPCWCLKTTRRTLHFPIQADNTRLQRRPH